MFKQFIFNFLLLFFVPVSLNSKSKEVSKYYEVKRIIDGDTFVVEDGSQKGVKVRLIGVDAPETRKTYKKPVGYFGQESKEYLKKMLTNKRVKLVFDVGEKDQYGRLLAYVYVNDRFVNVELIKNGYATAYTIQPNVKYAEYFVKLERRARNNEIGLWGNSNL